MRDLRVVPRRSHRPATGVLLLCFLLAGNLAESELLTGPQDETAVDRGLVEEEVYWHEIINNHESYGEATHKRKYRGLVLGYVTPWNNKGYDVAKKWRGKFTHISPVWYQLRAKADGSGFELTGGHDVDQEWIAELRKPVPGAGTAPKIVPRVVSEVNINNIVPMFKEIDSVVELMREEAAKQGFDGIVFEGFASWVAMGMLQSTDFEMMGAKFVQDLCTAFHESKPRMDVILALPPAYPYPGSEIYYPLKAWEAQREFVDGFSLMTYDYTPGNRPGPNAPMGFIEDNMKMLFEGDQAGKRASKVFIGVNWYGTDFQLPQEGRQPLVGRDYVQLVKRFRPKIRFDKDSGEHIFEYVKDGEPHRVYYPTLYSMEIRLEQAQYYGAGVAIWELGQGLDYFLDLL